ncbi:MAG TPA: PEP-CTERM sorting domain-containing protein [Gemmataceae bacterium]|jgi:hypothetical protein|nr:PEP-CTERM sorting domain-containing protein [Gemmataceae bacterium]
MHRLRPLCALLVLLAAVRDVGADVGYSYVADQASYSGITGSSVSVKLYLVESVTSGGSDQTSLINRYFTNADFSVTYSGIASVGLGVEQTGLSSGGASSQILGPSIFTPVGNPGIPVGYNGIANNAGFTFAPNFTYNFTQNTSGGQVPMTGGSGFSQLDQNLNDPITGFNGNNLQVKAALGLLNSNNNYNMQNGILTDAAYVPASDIYLSGKILVGTLSIVVGKGTTTFAVKPLAQTTLTANPSATFNTIVLNGAFGSAPGTVTGLSGSTSATTLSMTAYGGPVSLDQSYTSATRPSNASIDSFNTINSGLPVAGPLLTPATASSLPFYTASGSPFVFTVASVPEPSGIALCGLLVALGAFRLRRRRVA